LNYHLICARLFVVLIQATTHLLKSAGN